MSLTKSHLLHGDHGVPRSLPCMQLGSSQVSWAVCSRLVKFVTDCHPQSATFDSANLSLATHGKKTHALWTVELWSFCTNLYTMWCFPMHLSFVLNTFDTTTTAGSTGSKRFIAKQAATRLAQFQLNEQFEHRNTRLHDSCAHVHAQLGGCWLWISTLISFLAVRCAPWGKMSPVHGFRCPWPKSF